MTEDRRPDNEQSSQWSRVRSKLRAEFGEAAYRSWLKPASFELVDGGTVRVIAPTRFMRDWIETQYGERLKRLWREEIPELRVLEIVHVGTEANLLADTAARALCRHPSARCLVTCLSVTRSSVVSAHLH